MGTEWIGRRARHVVIGIIVSTIGLAVMPAAGQTGPEQPASDKSREDVSATGPVGPELAELRTQNSRTYLGSDGARVARIYSSSVNYRAADGSWKPIDTALKPSGNGYRNTANRFTAELPATLGDGPVRLTRGTDWLSYSLRDAAGTGKATGDTIVYEGALDGVDLTLQSRSDSLKETLRLRDADAARSFTFDLAVSSGLTPRLRDSNMIDVTDGNGDVRFSLPAPFMVDAAGKQSNEVDYGLHRNEENGWTLSLRPSEQWLDAPGRQYPVDIDPTVFPGADPDCELDEAQPTTSNCGSTLLQVGYGTTPGGPGDHRAAVYFDVDSVVPKDADILHASLGLWLESQLSNSTAKLVSAYPATRAWTTSATWNSATASQAWTNAGGDFSTTAANGPDWNPTIGGSSGDTGKYWYWEVAGMARKWLTGDLDNHGVIFKTDGGTGNGFSFRSNEYSGDHHPYMSVTYSPYLGDQPGFQLDRQRLSDRIDLAVNTATGNLLVSHNELQLPGGFGPALGIGRSYNSLSDRSTAFGSNWSMNTGNDVKVIREQWEDDNSSRPGQYFYGPGGMKLFFADDHTSGNTQYYTSPKAMDATMTKDLTTGRVTLTDHQSQMKYIFHDWGPLYRMTDRNGKYVEFTKDVNGRLTQINDGRNRVSTFTYDGNNRISQMTDPAGRTYGYAYTSGRLTTYTDPEGNSTLYEYNDPYDADLLTKITTPGGRVTIISYFASGNANAGRVSSVKRVTSPTGSGCPCGPTTSYTYALAYDDTGTGTVTNPIGVATRYHFDEHKRRTTTNLDYGGSLARDTKGAYDTATGKANEHFAAFNSSSTASVSLTFNGDGMQDGSTTETGGSTGALSTSSEFGESRGFPSGGTPTGSQYLQTTQTNEQGKQTWMGYDAQGNLTSIQGKDNTSAPPSDTNASTIEINRGTGAAWRVDSTEDGNGNTTSYTYDADGNLTTITPPSPMAATTLDYGTTNGNDHKLARVVSTRQGSNGRKATYSYDNLDRVTQIVYSNGGTTSSTVDFTYDDDGNLTQRVDSGSNTFGLDAGTTTYTYDALNRIDYTDYPGTPYDDEAYDDASNLTSMADANGTTYYEYDALNRIKKLREPGMGSSDSDKVTYTWDEDSTKNDLTIKYPTSTEVRNHITYNKAGQMLSTCVWQYSSNTCAAATPLLKLTYDYTDGASSRKVVDTVTDRNGNITRYCYDKLDRVTRSETAASSGDLPCGTDVDQSEWFAYTYDGASNVLTRDRKNATIETYTYNGANQLCWKYVGTSANGCGNPPGGSSSFTFDSDGNETAAPVRTTSAYNDRNQLGSLTIGGTTTNRGVRSAGQAELSLIGSTGLTYTPLGQAGYGSDQYIRDSEGSLVSQIVGGTRKYFLSDNLGSTRALLATSGSIAQQSSTDERFSYDPYGRDLGGSTATQIGSATTRMGYASGMLDQGGLYHFGQRYYDPALQRWTQPDPLQQPTDLGQANRYGYVAGNPANWTDPSGRCITEWLCDAADWVGGAADDVNHWTYEHVNPFNDYSTLTRWVGDNVAPLADFVGCAASFGIMRRRGGDTACEYGYQLND